MNGWFVPDFGWALALTLVAVRLLPGLRRPHRSALVLALFLILMQVPVAGSSPGVMIVGLFGHLSIVGVLLLLLLLLTEASIKVPCATGELRALLGLIAFAGWIFYPLTMGLDVGLGAFDPYAFGYGTTPWMSLLVTLLALGAWLLRWYLSALVLFVPLLAWHSGLLDSGNLWDALLDPFLVLGASIWLLLRGIDRLKSDW